MKLPRSPVCTLLLVLPLTTASLRAQLPPPHPQLPPDSDRDGLSDALEQRLLTQFAPHFMIGVHDCSIRPAEFQPQQETPHVLADNGTIYGQAFPSPSAGGQPFTAELHFYHLWRTDCGAHGHALDTEHVAVLVRASRPDLESASWTALYWYAAAHENTVCDVSQVARASTLGAEDHGATVWISPGKHASYLNDQLCQRGCGADRCETMVPLTTAAIINLGEPGHPMNGSLFISSPVWPLRAKMSASNFPPAPLARLNQLPASDIAWFNPGRHPAQGIIARSSSTEQALGSSGRNTTAAISVAEDSTGSALSSASASTGGAVTAAGSSTGGALADTYRHTRHALASSAQHLGNALHLRSKSKQPNTAPQ